MATKVLFLGLDAADPDLLEQWAGEGHLPTIRRLLETSLSGRTENPPGLYVGAVWPSFSTSVSPARHTRYCYTQIVPGNYDSKFFPPSDLKSPFFWATLSQAGKRVAVIDVPKVSIERQFLNGIQIADWGTHDPEYTEMQTWPTSIKEGIARDFGIDPIHNCNGFRQTATEYVEFRDELLDRIARRTKLVRTILDQEPWDAVFAVFSESHCVGHQCWHVHDETHPRHDRNVRSDCGDPMLEVYRGLDAALAELLDAVDGNTLCVVLASHGMGPHYDASYLLDTILSKFESSRYPAARGEASRGAATGALKAVWSRLPETLKKRWAPARRAAKSVGITPNAGRRYFQIPNNDVFGGVRINLKGREPRGKVEPGPDFARICDALTEDLQTLVNQETGRPLVKAVLRTADVYTGPHMDYLPDLMVEWDRSAPIRKVYSPKIGIVEGSYTGCRTGDHKPQGAFFATGPGIHHHRLGPSTSVMDFGPSVAKWLGVPLRDVDGIPIERLFEAAH